MTYSEYCKAFSTQRCSSQTQLMLQFCGTYVLRGQSGCLVHDLDRMNLLYTLGAHATRNEVDSAHNLFERFYGDYRLPG
jgi:hypothetical protein